MTSTSGTGNGGHESEPRPARVRTDVHAIPFEDAPAEAQRAARLILQLIAIFDPTRSLSST
jgi:hypothetical protein